MAETTEQIFERVKKLVVERFDPEEGQVTMSSGIKEDLGADSLDVVDLIMELEQEFDLDEIQDEDAEKIATVGDIVTYIQQQQQ